MVLQEGVIYRFQPSANADPSSFRGSVAPCLTVLDGTVDIFTYHFQGEPNASQMYLDTEDLAIGNYPFLGEFHYLRWVGKTGTPRVAVSQSLILKGI